MARPSRGAHCRPSGEAGVREHFDSPGKILLLDREPPEPPRRRRKEAIEAQQERLRALNAQGYITSVGRTGATVWKVK
jgi:hypothetical protein